MTRVGTWGAVWLGVAWLIGGDAAAQTLSPAPVPGRNEPDITQPTEAQFTAVRYHEAMRAAELCADKKFTRTEWDKLAVLIGQTTQHRMLVGQEKIAIREARADMETRVTASGCKDPLVIDALRFYESFRDRLR